MKTCNTDSLTRKTLAHDRRRYFAERTRLNIAQLEALDMERVAERVDAAKEAVKRPYTKAYFRIDRLVNYGNATHQRWEECVRIEATDADHERKARTMLAESREAAPHSCYRLVGVVENVLDGGSEQ